MNEASTHKSFLTLKNIKNTIQPIPNTKSPILVRPTFSTNDCIIATNVLPVAFTPKILFNCDATTVNASADVNPAATGFEIKSIMKPSRRTPANTCTSPVMNVNKTARCQLPPAAMNIINELEAVGLSTTCGLEPKITY